VAALACHLCPCLRLCLFGTVFGWLFKTVGGTAAELAWLLAGLLPVRAAPRVGPPHSACACVLRNHCEFHALLAG
jgi:hypothetical protein